MWLLNAETFELVHFISEGEIPGYAILSHTWTGEEISFHEMKEGFHSGFKGLKNKPGWNKIEGTCRLAKEVSVSHEPCDFVWIDTCCIDKSSSAELQEAINSMFRWYENARVCFVYLSDVPTGQDPAVAASAFQESRWFTRGWTLQELLAPRIVLFFDNLWRMIGCKDRFRWVIHSITGIDETYIASSQYDENPRAYIRLARASVAERMSWAASRETTREEDIAYCLLGIFDIHMPMLYGEGAKAFTRLQEEIMKISDDNSLLCWGF